MIAPSEPNFPDPLGESPRVIGHYVGEESGPLVVAIGGIHGNEPAGVLALEQLFDLLREEPLVNPGFSFRGELLALRGNLEALRTGRRYIDTDLNRIWKTPTRGTGDPYPSVEARELDGLLAAIENALRDTAASELIMLDLHTTTAAGGVFSITGDDTPSLMLAAELGVPVIKGMLSNLQGTTLSYFRQGQFDFDRPSRAITFEAGAHDDPVSVDRALAATVNLLRSVNCVRPEDVSTHHDETLRRAKAGVPSLLELVYVHRLEHTENRSFRMRPGFRNFQPIEEGDLLADDVNGPIAAPCSGYLLMPLYQEQGDEGFFIVEAYESSLAY
ncbi:succinylglutamate desuccinylase/aspartoacylase family protein [Lewinella sp. JB7]|uniref:succinylglutamate desuccinylase/aspartoacylase family protein n=1 Tax=Lewinella sp. JB7 TaxID=2962887 RepID=UPI0020C9D229|nr:succinylglutamate desuccinylase/aspartoacylase family protein [Lewinella sp. JB7]MCP9237508.1 succinylglutamate desuccinylase/aspartoacylase family protein [Lewinella sp. JB7]